MTPADGPPVRTPRAFALPELLAILAVGAVLLAALAVATESNRRTARLGDDLAKFRFIGAATSSYAADHADAVWGFSWQGGVTYDTGFGDLDTGFTDQQAAANQAVYLLRTRAGRTDIPVISTWIPHVSYSHLVLVEYLDTALPDHTFISSGDRNRQAWANDPACFDQGCFGSSQPPPTGTNRRWPYSASFTIPAAFWDRSSVGDRVTMGSTHNTYMTFNNTELGGVLLSGTAFPSQKVFLHDNFAWHFGQRVAYATHREARLPLLFADGSAHVQAAIDSNPGWRPNQPSQQTYTQFSYQPSAWEPPAPPGSSGLLNGNFRWTRGGILGRDFGGAEIDTGL